MDRRAFATGNVDGTLIYPERAVPGAAEALAALKARGKAVRAVTNNSSLSRKELGDRFRAYGLPLEDEEVFSALAATAQFVAHEAPGARVHVFGNRGLRAEIERLGLITSDEIEVDYVVVGTHREITYDRLTLAMRALLHGARLVAVNADRMYASVEAGPGGPPAPGQELLATKLFRRTAGAAWQPMSVPPFVGSSSGIA